MSQAEMFPLADAQRLAWLEAVPEPAAADMESLERELAVSDDAPANPALATPDPAVKKVRTHEQGTFIVSYTEEDEPERQTEVAGTTVDPVRDYLKRIGKVPLLNAEMEVELSKRIEAGLLAGRVLADAEALKRGEKLGADQAARVLHWLGDAALESAGVGIDEQLEALEWLNEEGIQAKNHMLEANLRLVVSLAKRYTGRGMLFLDLIQEGNIGLIRAVEKFDYTKGYKFSTYATWWIRQAITRGVADQSRAVRLPLHMVEFINKLARVRRQMTQDLGREPSEEELARELDVTPKKVVKAQRYDRDPISLHTPMGDGDGAEFGDLIEDTGAISPDDAGDFTMLRGALRSVLGALTEREAGVIDMRYGLTNGQPKTLDDVGKVYGVTRERIRQIEKKALQRLHHPALRASLEGFLN